MKGFVFVGHVNSVNGFYVIDFNSFNDNSNGFETSVAVLNNSKLEEQK
jgi:hypothetical protein